MTRFGAGTFKIAVAALACGSLVVAAAQDPAPGGSGDEAGVRETLKSLTVAYNKADAQSIAALFAEDAAIVDADGKETRGREAIAKNYEEAFAEGPTARLLGRVLNVRFPTPDVASVSGDFELLDYEGQPMFLGRFAVLAVREDGAWKLSELRDYSVRQPDPDSHYGKLMDLEWMLGDWVDEGDSARVATSIRWAENRNFLVRTYRLEAVGGGTTTGTQWIGWDPQSRQIRSWVFDSDGGRGEAVWIRDGDRWVIKAWGVLRDGGGTSSTQILEPSGADKVKIRSVDRVIDGEVVADSGEVVMVRTAPAPGDDKASSEK